MTADLYAKRPARLPWFVSVQTDLWTTSLM